MPIENPKNIEALSLSSPLDKVEVGLSAKGRGVTPNPKALALDHFDPTPSQATPSSSFQVGLLWNKPSIAGNGEGDADEEDNIGDVNSSKPKVSNLPNANDAALETTLNRVLLRLLFTQKCCSGKEHSPLPMDLRILLEKELSEPADPALRYQMFIRAMFSPLLKPAPLKKQILDFIRA